MIDRALGIVVTDPALDHSLGRGIVQARKQRPVPAAGQNMLAAKCNDVDIERSEFWVCPVVTAKIGDGNAELSKEPHRQQCEARRTAPGEGDVVDDDDAIEGGAAVSAVPFDRFDGGDGSAGRWRAALFK